MLRTPTLEAPTAPQIKVKREELYNKTTERLPAKGQKEIVLNRNGYVQIFTQGEAGRSVGLLVIFKSGDEWRYSLPDHNGEYKTAEKLNAGIFNSRGVNKEPHWVTLGRAADLSGFSNSGDRIYYSTEYSGTISVNHAAFTIDDATNTVRITDGLPDDSKGSTNGTYIEVAQRNIP